MEPVLPMEPVLCDQSFDSNKHLFQIKWDGVRCLAYVEDHGIRLINRKLNERTAQYPDVIQALSGIPKGTILDGEIIALGNDGKPHFHRVLQRDGLRSAVSIQLQSKAIRVNYMVFDILSFHGQSQLQKRLIDRQALLLDTVIANDILHVVDSVHDEGCALFHVVEQEGLEGIVAKEKDSFYLPGVKSPLWQKIKAWQTMDAIVAGYTHTNGLIRSLVVGIQEDSALIHIGSVSSGVAQQQWRTLQAYFEAAFPSDIPCPFAHIPPPLGDVRWVRPEIQVRIRYLEWSPEGKLRNPVMLDMQWKEGTP